MSKNNNVNPGQYKVAGRERQGEDVNPEIEKAKYAKSHDAGPAKRKPAKGNGTKNRSTTNR
jgi:hypothetical protein